MLLKLMDELKPSASKHRGRYRGLQMVCHPLQHSGAHAACTSSSHQQWTAEQFLIVWYESIIPQDTPDVLLYHTDDLIMQEDDQVMGLGLRSCSCTFIK